MQLKKQNSMITMKKHHMKMTKFHIEIKTIMII